MEEMDRILGEQDRRSSDIFLCTPVLGMTRRRMRSNIDVDIETRMVSNQNFVIYSIKRLSKIIPIE